MRIGTATIDPEVVVDASVALQWVLPEPQQDECLAWLDAHQAAKVTLIAPSHLMAEVANALVRRSRRRLMSESQARQAYRFIAYQSPDLVDISLLYETAFELSLALQISVYDGLYLALARDRDCALVTADRRFHANAWKLYSRVRLP